TPPSSFASSCAWSVKRIKAVHRAYRTRVHGFGPGSTENPGPEAGAADRRSHADRKPDEEPPSERIIDGARRAERVVRRRPPDDGRILVEQVVDPRAQPISVAERPAPEQVEPVVRLGAERVGR